MTELTATVQPAVLAFQTTWADVLRHTKQCFDETAADFSELATAARFARLQRWALAYQAVTLSIQGNDSRQVLANILGSKAICTWPETIVAAAYGKDIREALRESI